MRAITLVLILASASNAQAAENPHPKVVLTDAARELHRTALLFDGHNDLPWALREQGTTDFDKFNLTQSHPELHTDIPRLQAGGVGAQFWSVYVPADTATRGTALLETLEQIDLVKRMLAKYPRTFELALTADDVERIHGEGRIASLIGVEGGHCIENSLGTLRRLHSLGARYMTLTHSKNLDWADSATDDAKHGGLTPFGEDVVREMNQLGMLVDLSHVSPAVMKHALRITTAPVIFSHSSARAIADHPRNVPDDVLRLTAANGGVVMVNFFSTFIVPDSATRAKRRQEVEEELRKRLQEDQEVEAALARWDEQHPNRAGTIHDVIDHIDHIVKVAGVDHVGLGSDYDGVSRLPAQLEDVSTFPLITQELLNRGYSAPQIRKILGLNVLRVFRAAEAAQEPAR